MTCYFFSRNCKAVLFLCFSLLSQPAFADFIKAIDAYQKRDGVTMLKEVKESVDKKNNDGLMLFMSAMSIDGGTSMKTSLYKGSQENKQTTLKNILTDQQRQELIELLITATNNSNADAQLYLSPAIRELNNPLLTAKIKTNDEYAKSGSLVAANYSKLNDIERAALGDPFAQMLLGLSYLRTVDYRKYGCDESPEKPICRPRDEIKGYYWLKESLKNFESKGHGEMGVFYNSMCDLLQSQDSPKQLKQAYLWCILGMKSSAQNDSFQLLDKMHRSGMLKIAARDVDKAWNSSSWEESQRTFATLSMSEGKELPEMLFQTRRELQKSNLPVFTYYVNDYMEYEIDVYSDGRVNIAFGSTANGPRGPEGSAISFVDIKKELLIQLTPKEVSNFLTELKNAGFDNWVPVNNDIGFCDWPDPTGCVPKRYQVTVRDKEKVHRFHYFGLAGYVEQKNKATTRLGFIASLVEKHFPTKALRCQLGWSVAYKRACEMRDVILADISNNPQPKTLLNQNLKDERPNNTCGFNNFKIPSNFTLYAIGGYSGRKLSFQIDQSGRNAVQVDVAVNNTNKPVILMLSAYDPTIWNIGWSKGTKISAVFVSGYHRQVVAGLSKNTPLLISTDYNYWPCEHNTYESDKFQSWNPIAKYLFKKPFDVSYQSHDGIVLVGAPLDGNTKLLTSDAILPESYNDPTAPLAGLAGLADGLKKGVLRKATSEDTESWLKAFENQLPKANNPTAGGVASAQSTTLQHYNTYVVLKSFKYPSALYHENAVTFLVPKAVPEPLGNPGHSTIYNFNTLTCEGRSCLTTVKHAIK